MKTVFLAPVCAADRTAGSTDLMALNRGQSRYGLNKWMFPSAVLILVFISYKSPGNVCKAVPFSPVGVLLMLICENELYTLSCQFIVFSFANYVQHSQCNIQVINSIFLKAHYILIGSNDSTGSGSRSPFKSV